MNNLNTSIFSKIPSKQNGYIVMSCVRCSCFNQVMADLNGNEKDYLLNYTFITDTACSKVPIPVFPLQQKKIDELSSDIYNIVLIKKRNGIYSSRIIETSESDQFISICRKFFG